MNFQEIFNEDGRYSTDSFANGYCYLVSNGFLYSLCYNNINDSDPKQEEAFISKRVFDKNFHKVNSIKKLFK